MACVAVLAVAAIAIAQGGDEAPAAPVGVSPQPGARTASPRTEISFRGIAPGSLGEIAVSGSRSGAHGASVRPHSDGQGASLVFSQPFTAGEQVSVSTALDVAGATDGDFAFRVVARPREGLGSGSPPPRSLLAQLTRQTGVDRGGAVPRYRSRPDLRPPELEVRRAARGTSDGFLFASPKKVFGARPRAGLQSGPMILDDEGEPVWFAGLSDGNVNDFRVQRHQDRPVLTWWQGRQVLGSGEGVTQIVDTSYKSVARVRAGNGYSFDFHEARLTDRGTYLGLVYSPVDADTSAVGGTRDGRVIDSVVQEVDVATGRVLFEWHSLDHIALSESHGRAPASRSAPFDYFHINSVSEDTDGNLLISGRETWAGYKIDRRTGRVMWRLGGRRSTFRMPSGAVFAWQHDIQRDPDGSIRIFDNEAAPRVRSRSRVLWLDLDEAARTVRVRRSLAHPESLLSGTQGNAQKLADGHTVVGWGSQGYFTEYDADGDVVFDVRVARGNDSYRAYRFEWTGTPDDTPAVAAQRRGARTAVWASWNGATEVASWQVLAGTRRDALAPAGAARRSGFETAIVVPRAARFVAVRARNAAGEVIGTSATRTVRSGA